MFHWFPSLPAHPKVLIFVAFLAGCGASISPDARFGPTDPDAPYPQLIPLGPLLAEAALIGQQASPDLDSRIAALSARAATLRRPIIDRATRERMMTGVAPPALQ